MIEAVKMRRVSICRVRLSDNDYQMLRMAAIKRGTNAEALINRVVHILLHEQLIDAVLDDRKG